MQGGGRHWAMTEPETWMRWRGPYPQFQQSAGEDAVSHVKFGASMALEKKEGAK